VCGFIAFGKTSFAAHRLIAVSIPQSKTPIVMRPRTSDAEIFEQIFVHEQYSLPTNTSPKLIVDGGANVGFAAVYFANRYPRADIIAIEPEESNFQILRENTALYPKIKILQSAIWSVNTRLRIENPEDPKDAFRVQEAEQGEGSVDALTIDEVLKSSDAPFIDILKLDIEGAEKEVFESSEPWLDRVGVFIVELHDRLKPGCSEAFYSAVSKLDFREDHKGQNVILVRDVQNFNRTSVECERSSEDEVAVSLRQIADR
jgi:FkbM family methyltransferase